MGGRAVRSADGGGQRFELLERGDQLAGHSQARCRWELGAAGAERQATGDVQQLVAQPLRFGVGQHAVEQQRLGPDDQVVASITIWSLTWLRANSWSVKIAWKR